MRVGKTCALRHTHAQMELLFMQVMMVYLTTVLPCCLLQRHYLSRHISSYSVTSLCLHFLEPLCVVRITMIHFVASRSCGASLVHDASLLHLTTQYSIYHEQDQDQKMCMIPVMSTQDCTSPLAGTWNASIFVLSMSSSNKLWSEATTWHKSTSLARGESARKDQGQRSLFTASGAA